MTRQKGFTLTEVIIAIIISLIAIFGIETLIVASFKDWKTGKEIVDLQRDLDVVSYQIKGVLEEASVDTIYTSGGTVSNIGIKIVAGNSSWLKEFYRVSGNGLIYKNALNGNTQTIINTLQSITFTNGSDERSVRVDLTVVKGEGTLEERKLDNSFLVYLRNKGGG